MDNHPYRGIAHKAAKLIACTEAWQEGDCFANLPEPNDCDMCDPCHLVWRLQSFDDEAQDWWEELA